MSFFKSAASALLNYTPLGWLNPAGLASHLLSGGNGVSDDVSTRAAEGISDSIFGTTYGQERLAGIQYNHNLSLAQQSQDWQERMIAADRSYNSPANQMALFRAAGLNPSLVMSGNAPDLGGTSPSPSMASVSQGSALHGNISLADSLLSSQARLLESQASKSDAETKVMLDKLPKELSIMDETIGQIKSVTTLNGQLVEQSKAYTKVLGEDFQQKFIENEFLSNTLDARMKIVYSERDIKAAEAAYAHDNLQAQLNNIRESTRLMRSNRFLNAQLGAHYAAIDRHLTHVNNQLDKMSDYIESKRNNIKVENVMGFINAGANGVKAASDMIGTILSRGQKPTVNVGKGNNQWDVGEPDYGLW